MRHAATQGIPAAALFDEERPTVLFLHDLDFVLKTDPHAEQPFPQGTAPAQMDDSYPFPRTGQGQGKRGRASGFRPLLSVAVLHVLLLGYRVVGIIDCPVRLPKVPGGERSFCWLDQGHLIKLGYPDLPGDISFSVLARQ
jgi:hypothetical protein